jgi:hypothetical protein
MSLILSGSDGVSDIDGTAATPAIRGTDANTGIFFGSDIIGFSEDGTQCGEFDASANFKFNSGYGSVAVAYGCRAWVNFNGTGTPAIRGSGNVTSITDGGTGTYTVNFTNAMPDANYCTHVTVGGASTGQIVYLDAGGTTYPTQATSSVAIRIREGYVPFGAFDVANANVSVFR